ncbi:MAG: hypothetical protein JXQ76_00350 [Campylobacterales bacterium]|nr:hypothetical protein [Campylobacterales bacterium]
MKKFVILIVVLSLELFASFEKDIVGGNWNWLVESETPMDQGQSIVVSMKGTTQYFSDKSASYSGSIIFYLSQNGNRIMLSTYTIAGDEKWSIEGDNLIEEITKIKVVPMEQSNQEMAARYPELRNFLMDVDKVVTTMLYEGMKSSSKIVSLQGNKMVTSANGQSGELIRK